MPKYINNTERVIVVSGDKFLIPGLESTELTAEEESHTVIQAHVKSGHLTKIATSDINEDTTLDNMTLAQLKECAAGNNIDLGQSTKKEDIVAIIKAAEPGK